MHSYCRCSITSMMDTDQDNHALDSFQCSGHGCSRGRAASSIGSLGPTVICDCYIAFGAYLVETTSFTM